MYVLNLENYLQNYVKGTQEVALVRSEIFVQGTQPTEFCDVHVELEVDTTTNKIANEYCPEESSRKESIY